jgi:hypothetical protein
MTLSFGVANGSLPGSVTSRNKTSPGGPYLIMLDSEPCPKLPLMCERSIYLRDQADKCRWHASHIGDPQTQAELRKLANEYIVRAVELEGAEIESTKQGRLS